MRSKVLMLGDTLALFIITLIGFATHGETAISFWPRLLATFIPLAAGWFLLAPRFGLFTPTPAPPNSHHAPRRGPWREAAQEAARTAPAMLFAGPLAVVLRGLILNAPIIPIFALVLSTTSALGLIIWRALYFVLIRSRPAGH